MFDKMVDHVHFHVIPKDESKGDDAGLVVGWPSEFNPSMVAGYNSADA